MEVKSEAGTRRRWTAMRELQHPMELMAARWRR
jgi:hypothetical protein